MELVNQLVFACNLPVGCEESRNVVSAKIRINNFLNRSMKLLLLYQFSDSYNSVWYTYIYIYMYVYTPYFSIDNAHPKLFDIPVDI
jgi:hypothetical protein